MSTYVDDLFARARAEMPDCDDDLLRSYALLARTRGQTTTLADVHDAWALWRHKSRPDHPSIIPFYELAPSVQELGRPYMEAIWRISK
jgi:hypothetical protein